MQESNYDRNVVLEQAKETALWSISTNEEGADYEMLDEKFSTEDITGKAEEELKEMIDNFFEQAETLLVGSPLTADQIGHDIILTANRHGAGFWDRGLGELGDKLTEICHGLGSYELYVGDDGKLYT